jgi:hypothetical protein
MRTFTPTVFSKPNVRYLRLGTLFHEGPRNITAVFQPSQKPTGADLSQERFDFLASLDVTEVGRKFTAAEKATLLNGSDFHVIQIIDLDEGMVDLDFIPVRRTMSEEVSQTDDALHLRSASGQNYTLGDVEALLVGQFDGVRSFSDAVREALSFIHATPDALEALNGRAAENGMQLERFVVMTGLALMQKLINVGANTAEPADLT